MKRRHRRRLIEKTGTWDTVSETPSPSSRRVRVREGDNRETTPALSTVEPENEVVGDC